MNWSKGANAIFRRMKSSPWICQFWFAIYLQTYSDLVKNKDNTRIRYMRGHLFLWRYLCRHGWLCLMIDDWHPDQNAEGRILHATSAEAKATQEVWWSTSEALAASHQDSRAIQSTRSNIHHLPSQRRHRYLFLCMLYFPSYLHRFGPSQRLG